MARKVMFICAHNQTRSVAGEALVKGEQGFEVRSRAAWRGTSRKVRPVDCAWADEIYVMMPGMATPVVEACPDAKQKIRSLWIPDTYMNCEDSLLKELKQQLKPHGINIKKSLEEAKKDCWEVTEKKLGWGTGAFMWTWGEPSEEMLVKEKHDKPELVEREEFEGERWEYPPYVPMYHIREGERRMETAEIPLTETLARFEEAEAYVKKKQTMREKEKSEHKMLKDLEYYTKEIAKLFKR